MKSVNVSEFPIDSSFPIDVHVIRPRNIISFIALINRTRKPFWPTLSFNRNVLSVTWPCWLKLGFTAATRSRGTRWRGRWSRPFRFIIFFCYYPFWKIRIVVWCSLSWACGFVFKSRAKVLLRYVIFEIRFSIIYLCFKIR